jgi:hypothetical protein
MSAETGLVPLPQLNHGALPVARMRSVYRLDDVENRLRDLWRGQGNAQLSLEKTIIERE